MNQACPRWGNGRSRAQWKSQTTNGLCRPQNTGCRVHRSVQKSLCNSAKEVFVHTMHFGEGVDVVTSYCVRVGGVPGVLTLICGGVAQTCHDDRVVELKEQLGVEEVDGEGQEGKVKEEGRGRVKKNAP